MFVYYSSVSRSHADTSNSIVPQVCLNVTPVLAGLLFTYTSYAVTAAVIAAWNMVHSRHVGRVGQCLESRAKNSLSYILDIL